MERNARLPRHLAKIFGKKEKEEERDWHGEKEIEVLQVIYLKKPLKRGEPGGKTRGLPSKVPFFKSRLKSLQVR